MIALESLPDSDLPDIAAISAITVAELSAGPHVARNLEERARRQEELQRVEMAFDAIPFDAAAARAYGRVYAAVARSGRKARGRRALDLMIAATAIALDVPLYTCNPADFAGLEGLLEVVTVKSA